MDHDEKPRRRRELVTQPTPLQEGAVDETIGAIYDAPATREVPRLKTRVVVKKKKIAIVVSEAFAEDLDLSAAYRGKSRSQFVEEMMGRSVNLATEGLLRRLIDRKAARSSVENHSPSESAA